MSNIKLLSLLLVLVSLTLPLLSPPPTHAVSTHLENVDSMSDKNTPNLVQYGANNLSGEVSSLGCMITGCEDASGDQIFYGVIPTVGDGIRFLATRPPVMTSEYIADVMHNSGIVQPAYAQGIGFSSLSPILVIWKAFRNVAYFLLVVVFVVIGFMIMFRAQINPQTVVTIQTAFPQIIITLILITFSYAIAGFVVDLIYLLIFLATQLFMSAGILASPDGAAQAQNAIFGYSIFRVAIKFFISPFEAAGSAANSVSAVVQGLFGLPGLGIFDWLIDGLAYLIIAVAILIAFFRTFFALLMAYIGIIMSTIFAPIQLLLHAFPGSNAFGGWLKGLAANAAVFPAVAIMIIIGAYIIGGNDSTPSLGISESGQTNAWGREEGSGFIPPLITSRGSSFWDADEEFGVEHMRSILGLGIIMLLPEIVKLVKGLFGVQDQGLGEMAAANFQRGTGIVTAPAGFVGGIGKTVVGGLTSSILQGAGGAVYQRHLSPYVEELGNKFDDWRARKQSGDDVIQERLDRVSGYTGQQSKMPAAGADVAKPNIPHEKIKTLSDKKQP